MPRPRGTRGARQRPRALVGLWGSAWRLFGRAAGGQSLARGAGRGGRGAPSVWDTIQQWLYSLESWAGASWPLGGLKTFFPWKVASGSVLGVELLVPLPPPAGALAVGCGCAQTLPGWGEVGAPGRGRPGGFGARVSLQRAPALRSFARFPLASRFGESWVDKCPRSGWEGTDLTPCWPSRAGWGEGGRQEVDGPETEVGRADGSSSGVCQRLWI